MVAGSEPLIGPTTSVENRCMKPLRSIREYLLEQTRSTLAIHSHCDKPTRLQASSEAARDMAL
jgi:hypothetical protein